MKNPVRVALIGDFSTSVRAHAAIPGALNLAAAELGCGVHFSWMATCTLEGNAAEKLEGYHGIWCVPGSPYASMDGALNAIQFARERGCPFLGTCGGFQHALIEYARNVLRLTNADHAESNPAAPVPFIARLTCSLSGGEGTVHLTPDSRVFSIYGASEAIERYNCNFGLNSGYRSLLDAGGMRVAGVDSAGEVRIVELDNHPFYIATLFQPELAVFAGVAHPLIKAFVREAAKEQTRLVEIAHNECYIANSLKCQISVEPTIEVRKK